MLVTFTSSTSGEIVMFAEIAHRLFEIVGKECTARGVFTKEQLPDAIKKLRQAVQEQDRPDDRPVEAAEDGKSPNSSSISIARRAHPLLELMDLTCRKDGYVMWYAEHAF